MAEKSSKVASIFFIWWLYFQI